MDRFFAATILFIPIFLAVLGVKLIRDTLFSILHWPFPNYPVQFIVATILFIIGTAFIVGYIYRRDWRRNKVKK